MSENLTDVKFLIGIEPFTNAVRTILSSASNNNVYISGPIIRPLTEMLMSALSEKNKLPNVYMIVPSITGKDYAGSSLLYYVNLLSKRIRINSKAYHNIIAGGEEILIISFYSRKYGEYSVSAVWVKNKTEAAKATSYCEELWHSSLPLHFDE